MPGLAPLTVGDGVRHPSTCLPICLSVSSALVLEFRAGRAAVPRMLDDHRGARRRHCPLHRALRVMKPRGRRSKIADAGGSRKAACRSQVRSKPPAHGRNADVRDRCRLYVHLSRRVSVSLPVSTSVSFGDSSERPIHPRSPAHDLGVPVTPGGSALDSDCGDLLSA